MFSYEKQSVKKGGAITEIPKPDGEPVEETDSGSEAVEAAVAAAAKRAKAVRAATKAREAARRKKRYEKGQLGLAGSALTIAKGLGNACAGVAANPVVLGVGVALGLASLAYLLWTYLS